MNHGLEFQLTFIEGILYEKSIYMSLFVSNCHIDINHILFFQIFIKIIVYVRRY